jgi:uncharacterized protein
MATISESAAAFLACRRIAVAGVSRAGDNVATIIFRKLVGAGYDVVPVNPKADTVEDVPCYPDLASIPGGVEAVMIATHPDFSADLVRECAALGIGHVWLHRSLGQGSYSEEAERVARESGIPLIPYGCPMMYVEPDIVHRCARWIMRLDRRPVSTDAVEPRPA